MFPENVYNIQLQITYTSSIVEIEISTEFFRKLSHFNTNKSGILVSYVKREPLDEWLARYSKHVEKETLSEAVHHKRC